MIARTLPARTPEEIARLVRSLGSHRYIAGRLHLVHAFVFDAVADAEPAVLEELREARAWAAETLANRAIDPSSRDERLCRRATERELGAVLGALWSGEAVGASARARLAAHLEAIEAPLPEASAPFFDETTEEDVFPVLIDAGWELLPLAALDPEKHRGAIEAFGDPFAFDVAKFEEESAEGAPPPLQELPAMGPHELLRGAEHGILRAPLVLWTEGSETYHDYVMRGVLRAAKLD